MRSLRASRDRFRTLFRRSVAGMFCTTMDGEFVACNEAFAEMLGFEDPSEVEQHAADEFYRSSADRRALRRELEEEGRVQNYELPVHDRDGRPFWVLEHSFVMDDPVRERRLIWGTAVDITPRKELEEELQEQAYRDPLTGVANRRLLREEAARALARADRSGDRVAVGYVDLVRFKRINDTLGHEAGDEALVAVARRLEGQVRESDLVARVGGDEFALLLPELEDVEDARAAGDRILECLDRGLEVQGHEIRLDLHLGVAVYPEHGSNFEELLRNADWSMSRAAGDGNGGARLFRTDSGLPRKDALALEEALRRALDEGELTLHYQPIFAMPEGGLRGAEALVRWKHPERGLLGAAEFVPLAEKLGLIDRVDRWVLGEAARQAAGRWSGPAGPDWVTVNVSNSLLSDPGIVEHVEEVLGEAGLEARRLVVEVTERSAMRNAARVAEALHGLRELGVRTVIDDFGTGHAVLAYLKHFPAEMLKIDRLFLQDAPDNEGDRSLVEAIAGLGRGLGLKVVAEGVETEDQYAWIEASGCDFVQGFLTGEPVPAEELEG